MFEEDCQFIFDGEVVATCQENSWFRAKVMKCNEGEVLVSEFLPANRPVFFVTM